VEPVRIAPCLPLELICCARAILQKTTFSRTHLRYPSELISSIDTPSRISGVPVIQCHASNDVGKTGSVHALDSEFDGFLDKNLRECGRNGLVRSVT
jgi:hypothetical protein